MKLRGKYYATEDMIEVEIAGDALPEAVRDDRDLWICPSLFDNQVNGYGGYDFNSATVTPDDVRKAIEVCWQTGTGRLCPTITTGSHERMVHALQAVAAACDADPLIDHAVVGIHVEGPYISREDGPRGAHPLEHVREPSWDEFQQFQEAAGGRIKIFTIAPEAPGALDLIERLSKAGVTVALGHHCADPEIIDAAIKAGARTSTHLGNAAHAVLRRHPNYIWEQLGRDELWCSIIADGHHLPPSVVKVMVRTKGKEHTILTSDALYIAGMPPGNYTSMGLEIEVTPEGRAQLRGTPYLAGAAMPLAACVGNAVRFAGISLQEAIDMASINPFRLLGIEPQPVTAPQPDLLAFRWDAEAGKLTPVLTVLQGQVVG